jgi:hypothetical protein
MLDSVTLWGYKLAIVEKCVQHPSATNRPGFPSRFFLASEDRMSRHALRGSDGRFLVAARSAAPAAEQGGKRAVRSRREKEEIFFRELSMVCNVSSALRRSGLAGDVYKRRRNDPAFRRRWEEAIDESYALLELEMLERARFGESRPGPKSVAEKRLREVPTATAMQLLRFYQSRVKARIAAAPPPKPVRRTARAEAVEFRRELNAALSELNRRMGGNG